MFGGHISAKMLPDQLKSVEATTYPLLSMEEDVSVVKISFQGQEKSGLHKFGNWKLSCREVVTPVKYGIYVRGMGCSTSEDGAFYVVEGVQFNGKMKIGPVGPVATAASTEYTYEGWF